METFKAHADKTLSIEDFLGQRCWVGLDLASKRDIASACLTFKRDGRKYAFLRHYVNQQAVDESPNAQYKAWAEQGYLIVNPGPVTDHTRILTDLIEDTERFEVCEVGLDPHNGTLMSQQLGGYTTCVDVRQSVLGMSGPTKALDAAIRRGELVHDGNPVTEWMFSNVRVTEDKKGNVYPFKDKPEAKIDGAVATIISVSRADADNNDDDSFNDFIGLTKVAGK
jgi:phage terminase large subunit-like protein